MNFQANRQEKKKLIRWQEAGHHIRDRPVVEMGDSFSGG